MVGKRVQIDDEMWQAINLLRQDRRRSFQQLAIEALRDLLAKHHRPVGLADQLRESLVEEGAEASRKPKRAAPKSRSKPSAKA
jgi:hypothetical protein